MSEFKKVAVLSRTYRVFDYWVNRNRVEGEFYIWVDRVDDVRGRVFSRVEKLCDWYLIPDVDEILEYLESHLKV